MEPSAELPPSAAATDLEAVFREHAGQVSRTLRALGVGSAVLDDALQEVFLVVQRRLGEFEGRAKLSTWIYAITYRVAQSQRRHSRRHDRHAELVEDLVSRDNTPQDSLAQKQAAQFMLEFCSSLPVERRDVFVLCVLENRSAPEVAEVLNVKLNTVYSRLRVARSEFRSAIESFQSQTRCA